MYRQTKNLIFLVDSIASSLPFFSRVENPDSISGRFDLSYMT